MSNKKRDFDMDEVADEVERLAMASDHLKTLSGPAKQRLYALEKLYKRYTDFERQYRDELEALERKYLTLYQPLLDRRAAIVSGDAEPAGDEIVGFVADPAAPAAAAGERGLPMFWFHALNNNETVRELTGLNERDEEVLAHLTDIRYTLLPRVRETITVPSEDPAAAAVQREVVKQGFQLTFTFAPNQFFSDTVLSKTYFLTEDEKGDPMFDRAEATKPQWLPGKNVTIRVIKKTNRTRGGRGGKRGGNVQVQTVEEPCPSFFQFFNPPQLPTAGEEMDPDEFEEISAAVQEDFEIGCEIRDNIIPKGVLWYTGQAIEEDGMDDEFDDEDDEDGDDDDEDDDEEDDDEEEEEDEPVRKPRGGKNAGAADQKENPECKQQ